jgi:hypothetical protein
MHIFPSSFQAPPTDEPTHWHDSNPRRRKTQDGTVIQSKKQGLYTPQDLIVLSDKKGSRRLRINPTTGMPPIKKDIEKTQYSARKKRRCVRRRT